MPPQTNETGGILNFLKPPGMTSHDCVDWARRVSGVKRIGHAGTLDPAAAGVLLLLVGSATKLSNAATNLPKTYRAEATFGVATDTGDAQGRIIEARAVSLDTDALRREAAAMTGPQLQTPPMTSAVKVDGRKLYKLARKAVEIERPAREINIYALDIIEIFPDAPHPRALLNIRCSRGTYIRTLIEDLGKRLGFPAHASFLIRTAVGPFRIEHAVPAEDIPDAQAFFSRLLPPESMGKS